MYLFMLCFQYVFHSKIFILVLANLFISKSDIYSGESKFSK
jgi:hypothetical protein